MTARQHGAGSPPALFFTPCQSQSAPGARARLPWGASAAALGRERGCPGARARLPWGASAAALGRERGCPWARGERARFWAAQIWRRWV